MKQENTKTLEASFLGKNIVLSVFYMFGMFVILLYEFNSKIYAVEQRDHRSIVSDLEDI